MAPRFAFYAVAQGRSSGIYNSWEECKKQVDGFQNAKYKKFTTKMEALEFIREHDQLKVCDKVILKKKRLQKVDRKDNGKIQKIFDKIQIIECQEASSSTLTTTKSDDGYERNTNGLVVVYTDGACSNNQRRAHAKAGYGLFWHDGHPDNESGPVYGEQTNNRGEVLAVIRAIEIAKQNGLKGLCIRTDSQFLIDSMTKWREGWKKKGWKTATGAPVKNLDLMQKLDQLMATIQVIYEKVPAHSGVYGNEMADRLAVQGAQ